MDFRVERMASRETWPIGRICLHAEILMCASGDAIGSSLARNNIGCAGSVSEGLTNLGSIWLLRTLGTQPDSQHNEYEGNAMVKLGILPEKQ